MWQLTQLCSRASDGSYIAEQRSTVPLSGTPDWRYRPGTTNFSLRDAIRQALVDTFAAHDSRSVQHTQYAMGRQALAVCPDITEITLTMPNRHNLLVDLAPFGLDNPNEIFVATDQPFGLIESTITRD